MKKLIYSNKKMFLISFIFIYLLFWGVTYKIYEYKKDNLQKRIPFLLMDSNSNNQNLELTTKPELTKPHTIILGIIDFINYKNKLKTFLEYNKKNLREVNLGNLDLHGANLSHANLSGVNLVEAKLTRYVSLWEQRKIFGYNKCYFPDFYDEANLSEANLTKANLNKAELIDVNLTKAILKDANLDGANLGNAILSWANLNGASLKNTNLDNVDLEFSYLKKVNLSDKQILQVLSFCGVKFGDNVKLLNRIKEIAPDKLVLNNIYFPDYKNVNLSGRYLGNALLECENLSGVNLSYVDLTNANLNVANLNGTDLSYANLSEVFLECGDLSNANLTQTNLSGADLNRVNLYNVNLSDTQIKQVKTFYGSSFEGNVNLLNRIKEIAPEKLKKPEWWKSPSHYDGTLVEEVF